MQHVETELEVGQGWARSAASSPRPGGAEKCAQHHFGEADAAGKTFQSEAETRHSALGQAVDTDGC